MEKNEKEFKTSKQRSYFVIKVLLFVLCVAVIVLLVVVAKGFATLNDLNSRVNAMEEEKNLDLKSLRREKHDHETRRSKRGIDEAKFNKAMIKLEKLEGRYSRTRFVITVLICKFLPFLVVSGSVTKSLKNAYDIVAYLTLERVQVESVVMLVNLHRSTRTNE